MAGERWSAARSILIEHEPTGIVRKPHGTAELLLDSRSL